MTNLAIVATKAGILELRLQDPKPVLERRPAFVFMLAHDELRWLEAAVLPSMQSGSNGRNREYRPRRSRTRFDWIRVPQVRVCDECRSASAEKANAREALMPY